MATREQALVSTALGELKFEFQEAEGGNVGGPAKFVVTDDTLSFIKGKAVIVDESGAVSIGSPRGSRRSTSVAGTRYYAYGRCKSPG